MAAFITAINTTIEYLIVFENYLDELLKATGSAERALAYLNDYLNLDLDLDSFQDELKVKCSHAVILVP